MVHSGPFGPLVRYLQITATVAHHTNIAHVIFDAETGKETHREE